MPVRIDLGQRVELVSVDPSFHDISVGLYRKDAGDGPFAVVHSYSGKPGVDTRIALIRTAMRVLGGLEDVAEDPDQGLRLPCRGWHNAAMKRLFLDCFRVDPAAAAGAETARGAGHAQRADDRARLAKAAASTASTSTGATERGAESCTGDHAGARQARAAR